MDVQSATIKLKHFDIKLFKQTISKIIMAIKRDDNFEDDEEEKLQSKFSAGFPTVIFGIIFLILTETFFYLLSEKTSSQFGLTQITFALMLTIIITLFLGWVRLIIRGNKYTGLFIGLLGTAAMVYALRLKYQGIYTTIFAIISSLLVLSYIIIQFVKVTKK